MYHTLQLLKPFGIAGFTASPLSEEFPYSRLLWEFLFRGSAANPTIAQSRYEILQSHSKTRPFTTLNRYENNTFN